jgi:putative tricarboxylic transport membrane protein
MESAHIIQGLYSLADSSQLILLILAAVPLGMIAGAIPGLGGKIAIVLAIPFVFGMEKISGAVFLLAMHAVVHTGGSIPSILFGIPGTGPDAATVVDGYPLTKKGEAGRALGAALAASGVGGIIGALVLALTMPLVIPIVTSFGPPETFLIALLGITFIAAVSGKHISKGLLVGCFGLLVSTIGLDPITGINRFSFDLLFLWNGVDLITAVLGIFAIPEMLAMVSSKQRAAEHAIPEINRCNVIAGMKELLSHKALTIRTSLIGSVVGIIPGLGGDAATWMCYGHAVQSSSKPEQFGKGAIEGVIAPETANNSKEGGSLLPTLFFGLPGSSGMALLLGAFVTLGIQPGPAMSTEGLPLVWTLIWTLVIANVIAVILFLLGSRWMTLLARFRSGTLFPIVLALAITSSLLSTGNWQSLILLFLFGIIGHLLKRYSWSRAPFVIGLILGAPAEIALHQSLAIWGVDFLERPFSMVLIAMIALSILFSILRSGNRSSPQSLDTPMIIGAGGLFAISMLGGLSYPLEAAIFPVGISISGLLIAFLQWHRQLLLAPTVAIRSTHLNDYRVFGWFLLFTTVTILLGVTPGLPLMIGVHFTIGQKKGFLWGLAAALTSWLILVGIFEYLLGLVLFHGVIFEFLLLLEL